MSFESSLLACWFGLGAQKISSFNEIPFKGYQLQWRSQSNVLVCFACLIWKTLTQKIVRLLNKDILKREIME